KIRFLGVLELVELRSRTAKIIDEKPIPPPMPKGFLKLFTHSRMARYLSSNSFNRA
ncbi:ATP-dependent RNA helicase HrpB, partial [Haemophilus influenzae]